MAVKRWDQPIHYEQDAPEPMVEDADGRFVLHADTKRLVDALEACAVWLEDELQERRASGFSGNSPYLINVKKLAEQAREAMRG